jgi:hypothetical protein
MYERLSANWERVCACVKSGESVRIDEEVCEKCKGQCNECEGCVISVKGE